MTTSRSFAEILDECVDRVVVRGESVEDCIRDFPEHARELREALSAGAAVSEAFAFLPDADRKRTARLRLHEAIERGSRRRSWWRLPLVRVAGGGRRLATVALIALVAVVGSSTGTVLAAQDSAPGELLYPVMRAGERVQLAFAVTDERESVLHARFMDRRVRELEAVPGRDHGRFVADLVAQIEHHAARAHGLAIAPMRDIVDVLPVIEDPAATPAIGRPALTPGSPFRRGVSVRRAVALNDQITAFRERIARFESRFGEGPSRLSLRRLREGMELTNRRLGDILDKADAAHQLRGTDPGPDAPDPRALRVPVRIRGIQVVHDGRNLLGVDVTVVAEEDGTSRVAHLTRRGTRLTVDGRPGGIRQLTLNRPVVLIVDGATGEIIELRIARARLGAEDEQPDRSGSGSGTP